VSDSVSRFEFDQFKAVFDAELRALRALRPHALRNPQFIKGEPGPRGKDAVIDEHAIDLKVETIAYPKLVELLATLKLPKDGEQGTIGKTGEPGPRGPQGLMGPMPLHKWVDDTKLAFEHPDGSFDDPPVELRGPPGPSGIGGGGGTVVIQGNTYFPSGWN
jgi:hypothetical protein